MTRQTNYNFEEEKSIEKLLSLLSTLSHFILTTSYEYMTVLSPLSDDETELQKLNYLSQITLLMYGELCYLDMKFSPSKVSVEQIFP